MNRTNIVPENSSLWPKIVHLLDSLKPLPKYQQQTIRTHVITHFPNLEHYKFVIYIFPAKKEKSQELNTISNAFTNLYGMVDDINVMVCRRELLLVHVQMTRPV